MSEESKNIIIKTNEYAYTADEQVQMWREAMVRWADYYMIVFMAGFAACAVFEGAFYDPAQDTGSFPFGIILLVLALIAGVAYPFWRTGRIRRLHTRLETSGNLVKMWDEFDDRFITVHVGDGQENRLILKDFMCYVVSNGLLYLYVAKKSFVAIPLRAFQSPQDERKVYQALSSNGVTQRRKHPKGGWK